MSHLALTPLVKLIQEFAYTSGKVTGSEYDTQFRSLLHQYQLCSQSINSFPGLDQFMDMYNI